MTGVTKQEGRHKGKGVQHVNTHTSGSLAAYYDALWAQGIDPLPPDIREKVDRIKARRQEDDD